MYYYIKYIDKENYALYASSKRPKKLDGLEVIPYEEYQRLLTILEAKLEAQEEE